MMSKLLVDTYRSCKARVEPQTPPLGKYDCSMIQLFDLCPEQIMTRVMLRHLNNVTCSAYGDTVYHLANKPKNYPVTKADLLKTQKLHEIQILTGNNIIAVVIRLAHIIIIT